MMSALLIAAALFAGSGGVSPLREPQAAAVAVPQPSALALKFYHTGNWLWLIGQVWGIGVPGVLLWSGASARMHSAARRVGRTWFFTIACYAVVYGTAVALVGLPLSYYAGYLRPHAYGLSEQPLARWIQHWAVQQAVELLLMALLLWVPYLIIARSPRWWWFFCGLLTLPFLVISVMIKPVWFDPLLNDYGPMHDKGLERKILDLAQQAGIDGGRVYEVDKSRDTNTVNAYVTGMFGTKRIVLWDTILKKLDEDEILVVMGHEMGHYVLGHLARGIVVSFLLTMVGLAFVHRVGMWILRSQGERFGFHTLADVASVPLLVLLAEVYSLAALPVGLAYSRHQEHEADRFALEITHANHAAGRSFVRLQQENLSHPRPDWYVVLWRGSHPSLGERIDFTNAYHPWRSGRPGRYEAYYRRGRADRGHRGR
jgi:Zn-dependent protease with chaperone function